MKTLIAWAALLLLVSPAAAIEQLPCDSPIDAVETLSQETYDVLEIPDQHLSTAVMVIEEYTGERYGKVGWVSVVQMDDHDVAVIGDITGCQIHSNSLLGCVTCFS